MASSWFTNCCADHRGCGKKYGPLPTRVLQLNEDEKFIILLEPKFRRENSYAALSHCWGTAKPIKTTKENIARHKSGIPLTSLPKTFRDAVEICRRLRIDYLWIDSLCIVQDSEEDWEEEAGQMASIYACAELTIAAHSAVDSAGGCFVLRAEAGPHVSTRVEYNTTDSKTGAIYIRGEPPGAPNGDHLSTNLPQLREAGPSRLSTRGWVFQERLLSRRTLHYTPHELVFECRQGFQCECTIEQQIKPKGPVKFKDQFLSNKTLFAEDWNNNLDFLFAQDNGSSTDIKERKPATDFDWYNIVEGFTQLNLTYDSDRLPALYGLCESKLRALSAPDEYLFGLWKSDLIGGLLWQVGNSNRFGFDGCDSKRQPESFAPSWSWASVTGPVRYNDNLRVVDEDDPKRRQPYSHRCKILEVKTVLSTSNKFGPGTGSINFLCTLVPVLILLTRSGSNLTSKSVIAGSKKAIPGKNETPFGYFNPDVRDNGSFEVGPKSEGDRNEYFFMIVAHLGHENIYGSGGKPLGLILRKTESGTYKRVGLMEESTYDLKTWQDISEPAFVVLE